jgi:hypothetical protein
MTVMTLRDAKTCGEADELFQRLTALPLCDAQTDERIVLDKTVTRCHPFHASDEGPYRLQSACFSPRHSDSTDGSDAVLQTSLDFMCVSLHNLTTLSLSFCLHGAVDRASLQRNFSH